MEDTSLSNHLNKFQGILDQMSRVDIKFEDEILDALNGVVSLQMVKDSVLNKEMRRKAQVLRLGLRCSLLEIGGEVRKRNKNEEEKKSKVSPSPNTRMLSVNTVRKLGMHRSIIFCGKKENKGKKGKSKDYDGKKINNTPPM
ncbi:hypothetical protein CR513_38140, partial [Mucuna pruriens]